MTSLPINHALGDYVEKAYLDYAMMVVMERALPHVGDGLKLVQRRIVYAMSELGLKASQKHKKSARTVGDVLGKYHPHGEMACYEAMVLMAQPFTYRYPLIDGQGNWGSLDDPKSFAAMRYTEARLTAYTQLLLQELTLGTAHWLANFDGTLQEPVLLPARVPNIVLNGTSGIAVGMATDIPPHHMGEVIKACLFLIDHLDAEDDPKIEKRVLDLVQGPDFPTGGEIITSREDIAAIYRSGRGSFRARATYTVEGHEIIIDSLPYQVSLSRLLEQMGEEIQNKKLPMIVGLRDESDDQTPVRIVIELSSRSSVATAETVMQHLFAKTDLEKSYRVNMNMIGNDGRPQVKSLVQILREWLIFRLQTVTRRTQHEHDQLEDRLHVLSGLHCVYLNLDEVIRIIRHEEDPKTVLMTTFSLSERQVEAILNTRLRHLARLEEEKIAAERTTCEARLAVLTQLLADQGARIALVKEELTADRQQFADKRRTILVEREVAKALTELELAPNEPVTVMVSRMGWLRMAKSHQFDLEKLTHRKGDELAFAVEGMSKQVSLIVDDSGKVYTLPTHELPSVRTQGEPVSKYAQLASGFELKGLLMGESDDYVVMLQTQGYGFASRLGDLVANKRTGKQAFNLAEQAAICGVLHVPAARFEQGRLALLSQDGRLLVIPLSELPILARGKGNRLMHQKQGEQLQMGCVLSPNESLICQAGQRQMTLTQQQIELYEGKRAGRGRALVRGFRRTHNLLAKSEQP